MDQLNSLGESLKRTGRNFGSAQDGSEQGRFGAPEQRQLRKLEIQDRNVADPGVIMEVYFGTSARAGDRRLEIRGRPGKGNHSVIR